MGSAGDKPRKPKRRLPKVPAFEEPNVLPLPGLTGTSDAMFGSRYGHSSDHKPPPKLGRVGAALLWVLGRRPPKE
jgi:hypothetical protein